MTELQFDDDIRACAEFVERVDPERFQAAMAAPIAARLKLFVIYAFYGELSRAPWASQESMIAEMRLQWWRDLGEDIAQGRAPKRHYVATPLAAVLAPELAAEIDAMAEARRWDIYRDPFADEAGFDHYMDKTAGSLMWLSARALGEADEAVARDVGYAHGLANWMRAIPALEKARRVPLLDGTVTGVQALAERGLDRLARARKHRGGISTAAQPALIAAWQAEGILKQVYREPQRVAEGELALSEFNKRFGLLWRSTTGRW